MVKAGTAEQLTALDMNAIRSWRNPEQQSLLFTAAMQHRDEALQICKALLGMGLPVNGLDALKRTPLFLAVAAGSPCVSLLLQSAADPNCQDAYQQTPIFYAPRAPKEMAEQLLQRQARIDLLDKNQQSAAFFAAASPNVEVAWGTCQLV